MQVFRSSGEPTLTYVLLTDVEIVELRKVLRKEKSPLSRDLRRRLKKVLRGR